MHLILFVVMENNDGFTFRETVQMLMSLLDSEGVQRRRQRRLKRRVYQNKVTYGTTVIISPKIFVNIYRDQILCGTLMDMTN